MSGQLKPMAIHEAIEVMKILRPHAAILATASSGLDMIRRLLLAFKLDNTEENIGRIVALTHRQSFDDVVARYLNDASTQTVFSDLVFAFQANPIPDLIDGAYVLGLGKIPWSKLNA